MTAQITSVVSELLHDAQVFWLLSALTLPILLFTLPMTACQTGPIAASDLPLGATVLRQFEGFERQLSHPFLFPLSGFNIKPLVAAIASFRSTFRRTRLPYHALRIFLTGRTSLGLWLGRSG